MGLVLSVDRNFSSHIESFSTTQNVILSEVTAMQSASPTHTSGELLGECLRGRVVMTLASYAG